MKQADIGLIGLAVMGENLVINIENKGFSVAVYNRTTKKVTDFLNSRAKDKNIIGAMSIEELVDSLKKPRKIMLMVKAGVAVDSIIDMLIPLLDKGDIIIDGGNSHFTDSMRRTEYLESKGLLFVGTGVSGGEEGALNGPSIMPGGSKEAWPHIKDIFQSISAKADDNKPCCDWIGDNGAGHFVKMVHNGIEYGDMQIISEAYHIMNNYLKMTPMQMHEVFSEWNKGDLESYLIEITSDILQYKDEDNTPLIDKILDAAGQKGTGKWTSIAAFDEGVPLTLIGEAVYARSLSAMKEERLSASEVYTTQENVFSGNEKEKYEYIDNLKSALFASKIVSYAQGFSLLKAASFSHNWNINLGKIALMWRGGCIIRSGFLNNINDAFEKNPDLDNLLIDSYFVSHIKSSLAGWRNVISTSVLSEIPTPAFASALSYFDGYKSSKLPANMIQAQRDYFGAHNYERVDKNRGEFFHTNWTGKGGKTSSSNYSV